MLSLLKRYRELLIVTLLLVYPLATFLGSGHRGRQPHLVDRFVLGVASPIQGGLTWVFDGIGRAVSGYVALVGVRQRNQRLEVENSQLRGELNAMRELAAENQRLKSVLAYVEKTPEREVVANIIGVNPVANVLSVRINRGENDGIAAGMPVVTSDGVVGQIQRAVDGWADVVLLTDRSSKIAVLTQRSRVRGTAAGIGVSKTASLQNVMKTDDVVEGDIVVTSGTDGIFPKGLVVGRVIRPERKAHGMFLEASIEPAVALGYLEEVMVIPVLGATAAVPSTREPGR